MLQDFFKNPHHHKDRAGVSTSWVVSPGAKIGGHGGRRLRHQVVALVALVMRVGVGFRRWIQYTCRKWDGG